MLALFAVSLDMVDWEEFYPVTLRTVGLAKEHELKSFSHIVSRSPQMTYVRSNSCGPSLTWLYFFMMR